MSEELQWLLEWFCKRREWTPPPVEQLAVLNYFDAALIDSMGVIELISDIEARFGASFTHADFQDRRFSTVGGLADLIAAKRAANKSGEA